MIKDTMRIDSKKLFNQFQSSGLSRKSFAEKVSISKSTLDYHIYKNRKKLKPDAAPAFTPLKLVDKPGMIKITLPNGTLVEIPL
jgi:hypothetical protein